MFQAEHLRYLTQGEWFTVFRYDDGTGAPMIIKRANIWTVSFKYLLREKAMLAYLNHPNIARPVSRFGLNGGFHPVACLGSGERYWNDIYFMFEDGGSSLQEWLTISREVSVRDVKSIALQLLEVLIYLERMEVVHRDIRMESFVWSRGCLKLISLGKAKHKNPITQAEQDSIDEFQTTWAKPPETRLASGFCPSGSTHSLLPMKRDFSDEGYLAPEAKVPGAVPECTWDWYAAGQVLLKLLQRCAAVQDDPRDRADMHLLQQIACAM